MPVWVALPFAPDWRWLLGREDSPWYPNMRLFRQAQPGDWAEVFERIAAKLKRATEEKRANISLGGWTVPTIAGTAALFWPRRECSTLSVGRRRWRASR